MFQNKGFYINNNLNIVMVKKKEDKWNIPNLLSMFRFLAAPICFYLIFIEQINWALFVFILAVLSDKLDGIIARKKRIETSIGETLDPIADVILIVSIAAAFILKNIVANIVKLLLY